MALHSLAVKDTVTRPRRPLAKEPAAARAGGRMAPRADYEKIPLGEDATLVVREFKTPRFTSPWHFHPEFELTYIVSGRGDRLMGDSMERFEPGDLVLVGSNLPHVWHSDPSQAPAAPAHSFVAQFAPRAFTVPPLAVPELAPVHRLLAAAGRGLRIEGALRDRTAGRLFGLRDLDPAARWVELLGLLVDLARNRRLRPLSSLGFVPFLDLYAGDRINRSCAYITERLTGEITLGGAAQAAGMSEGAFSRYFKKVMGKTLTRFVAELRVGRICRELLETDRSVAEIAFATGFNNLANFNRRFFALRGMTPQAFRTRSPAWEGDGRIWSRNQSGKRLSDAGPAP